MKEKMIAQLKARRYNSFVLYVVAGGYLVYLAYKMLRDMETVTVSPVLIYGLAVIFGLVGLALVSISLLAMSKGWFAERVAAEEDSDNGEKRD